MRAIAGYAYSALKLPYDVTAFIINAMFLDCMGICDTLRDGRLQVELRNGEIKPIESRKKTTQENTRDISTSRNYKTLNASLEHTENSSLCYKNFQTAVKLNKKIKVFLHNKHTYMYWPIAKLGAYIGTAGMLGYACYILIRTGGGKHHHEEIINQINTIVFGMSELAAKSIVAAIEILAGPAIVGLFGKTMYDFISQKCIKNTSGYQQIINQN